MKLRQQVLLAASLAMVAIWPTWLPLFRVWGASDNYQHGPLVALIGLVWLYRASDRADSRAADPLLRGVTWQPAALLALALALWLVAYKANVEIGKQAVAPVIIWLAVATASGWRAAATVSAPVLYLYFAIPVWDLLVPLLQWMTVAVAEGTLGLAGVPVRIEGVLITIPEGSFVVLEACSGERYLIVTLAAAALIAAGGSMDRRRTALYLALAGAIAILANWVRVITIIVAGHVTNMTSYLVAREHLSLGWAVFAALIVVVSVLGRKLSPDPDPVPAQRGGSRAAGAQGIPGRLAATAAVLCLPTLAILWLGNSRMTFDTPAQVLVPQGGSGWHGPVASSQRWLPDFPGATRHGLVAFESDGGMRVETYWAVYGRQDQGAKLVYYANSLTGKGWLTLSRSDSHRMLNGRNVTMRTLLTQVPGGARWLIDYYYVVNDVHVSREWGAQLLYGLLSWTHPTSSAVIAAAVECGPSCDAADRTLAQYWASSAS